MNSINIAPITIKKILNKYSVVLLDSYGVLIREFGLVNGAKTLVNSLLEAKKPFYVLTNDASVLPNKTALKYQKLGLNINTNNIITSGCALKLFFKEKSLLNSKCIFCNEKVDNITMKLIRFKLSFFLSKKFLRVKKINGNKKI